MVQQEDRGAVSRARKGDSFTGFLTRKSFEAQLLDVLNDAQKRNETVSVGFLDVDHFKRVNDEYGRAVGDAVLRHVVDVIQENADATIQIGRYGGEELALLFPGTEREEAFLRCERMRTAMDKVTEYRFGDRTVSDRITISGSVAAYPTDGLSDIEILRKADQALYRAKTTGRNKICIAQEERMTTKTAHFTLTQLERLSALAQEQGVGEAALLREALDDLLVKYKVSEVES